MRIEREDYSRGPGDHRYEDLWREAELHVLRGFLYVTCLVGRNLVGPGAYGYGGSVLDFRCMFTNHCSVSSQRFLGI